MTKLSVRLLAASAGVDIYNYARLLRCRTAAILPFIGYTIRIAVSIC